MRIIFFGSSHGVPEANRRCSSTLIEVGENRYFIDMGTQSIEQLITRKIPIDSVKGIFITHMHGDHTNGLVSFLDLSSWYFKSCDPVVSLPEPYEESVSAIRDWIKCNGVDMRPFRFQNTQDGLVYQDESISVYAFKTKHTASSFSYLVVAEGKRVLFSGDLCYKGPQEDFPVSVFEKKLDLAVCESAHFPATAYLPLFKEQKNLKQLCFNHYSSKFLPSVIEMVSALPDVNVFRAEDSTEVIL